MKKEQIAVIKEQLLEEKKSRLKEYREYAKKIFFDKKGNEIYFTDEGRYAVTACKVVGSISEYFKWKVAMREQGWVEHDWETGMICLTEKFKEDEV